MAGDPGDAVPERLAVHAALSRLGDLDLEVLTLTVWEELRPREVAVVLGARPEAVRTRLSRTRARLRELLGDDPVGPVHVVDVLTTSGPEGGPAAVEALAGVPLPPGLDPATLNIEGAHDPYQFGAAVTSRIRCAWIAEWKRADAAGAAVGSSRQWKVLRDMADEGDRSEVYWEIGDVVAAGKVPAGYESAIGCD